MRISNLIAVATGDRCPSRRRRKLEHPNVTRRLRVLVDDWVTPGRPRWVADKCVQRGVVGELALASVGAGASIRVPAPSLLQELTSTASDISAPILRRVATAHGGNRTLPCDRTRTLLNEARACRTQFESSSSRASRVFGCSWFSSKNRPTISSASSTLLMSRCRSR